MATTRRTPCVVVVAADRRQRLPEHDDPVQQPAVPRQPAGGLGSPTTRSSISTSTYGIPAYMAPMKKFWDESKLAVMHGVGYLDSPRSHFRSMDIWHTCEPDKVGTEGWLGRVAREFDPNKENVVTAVSFGPSLFRALFCPACRWPASPVRWSATASCRDPGQRARPGVLDRFAQMYSRAIGSGGDGISRRDRPRFAEGCGHPQGRAAASTSPTCSIRTRRSPAS